MSDSSSTSLTKIGCAHFQAPAIPRDSLQTGFCREGQFWRSQSPRSTRRGYWSATRLCRDCWTHCASASSQSAKHWKSCEICQIPSTRRSWTSWLVIERARTTVMEVWQGEETWSQMSPKGALPGHCSEYRSWFRELEQMTSVLHGPSARLQSSDIVIVFRFGNPVMEVQKTANSSPLDLTARYWQPIVHCWWNKSSRSSWGSGNSNSAHAIRELPQIILRMYLLMRECREISMSTPRSYRSCGRYMVEVQ